MRLMLQVPLRTFTAHPNSGTGEGRQGTFLGMLEKVRWHAVGLPASAQPHQQLCAC